MLQRATVFFALTFLVCMIPVSGLALNSFEQDFETLSTTNTSSLADDGWLVFANVFGTDGGYWYGYGPFPAPNDGSAFCQVVDDQGGAEQEAQQLVVFSDYNNADHGNGGVLEANVFQEQLIGPGDISENWIFDFQAKMGNLEGSSTAFAFIKTLNPAAGWAMTNYITVDLTAISADWADYSLSIDIDPSLDGQILQFGFMNKATAYEGSGVFYDNVRFNILGAVDTEEMTLDSVKSLYR